MTQLRVKPKFEIEWIINEDELRILSGLVENEVKVIKTTSKNSDSILTNRRLEVLQQMASYLHQNIITIDDARKKLETQQCVAR